MTDYLQKILSDQAAKVQSQREEILSLKLKEKGFGDLLIGLKTRRFPRIACIKYEGFDYFYADNGTESGVFIVAISEGKIPEDYNWHNSTDRSYSMTIEFTYQDTHPLPEFVTR